MLQLDGKALLEGKALDHKWYMEGGHPQDRRRPMVEGCRLDHMQRTEGLCRRLQDLRTAVKDTQDDDELNNMIVLGYLPS
jgi:hypothetical protein